MRFEREKPWDGGVRISALHRPTVFLSQVALALQFDCENNGFVRLPGDLETASKPPRNHLGSGVGKTYNSEELDDFASTKRPGRRAGLDPPGSLFKTND